MAANRLNAQKSTGPNTPEGKAISSQNAFKHGFYARTAILPSEDQEGYDRVCAGLLAEWQPQTDTEHQYVEQMAVAYWTKVRYGRARFQLFQRDLDMRVQLTLLNRVEQIIARLERSYDKALHELRSLQKARLQPQPEKKDAVTAVAAATSSPAVVPPPYVMAPTGTYEDVVPELHCLPNET